jgi:hypothetical protein
MQFLHYSAAVDFQLRHYPVDECYSDVSTVTYSLSFPKWENTGRKLPGLLPSRQTANNDSFPWGTVKP